MVVNRGKLKAAEVARLRFQDRAGATSVPLVQALLALVGAILARGILARNPKDRPAFERFLRADPHALLAREKPPLDLDAGALVILANLPGPAAEAWQELVGYLKHFPDYHPMVELRAIHHGLWNVNYDNRHGGKDLAALMVQNGRMTVRIILFGAFHFYVQDHLDEFGEPVKTEFHSAHWYEEFQHKWLFIPCQNIEDTVGIKKLLDLEA